MPHPFAADVVTAVLRHMNDDHVDDNLLIARAFGPEPPTDARMVGFDSEGGDWLVERADGSRADLRVAWPSGEITERAHVRREIVALYDDACVRLGIPPRPHA